MWWILTIGLQVAMMVSGIRQSRSAGTWSWPLFLFVIAFLCADSCLISVPLIYIDQHSRWFGWAVAAGVLIAVGNFVWFIIVCRRWKLPDGRTSLEAYYDEHPKK